MYNFNKYLVIVGILFSCSAANATKDFTVTNNATVNIGVDFYYYTEITSSADILAGQTQVVSTLDSSNYINVKPTPVGTWSGTAIRFAATAVKNNRFTVSSTTISAQKIRLTITSGGTQIGSGEFTKKYPY